MSRTVEDQIATMEANIKEKTGRSVADWVKLAKKEKLEKHGLIVRF